MVFIVILIIALAIATIVAFARGLVAIFDDGEALKNPDGDDLLLRGRLKNRMMSQRVLFQGLAILAVVLLGAVSSRS